LVEIDFGFVGLQMKTWLNRKRDIYCPFNYI